MNFICLFPYFSTGLDERGDIHAMALTKYDFHENLRSES
jgi:hypothetical protein